MSADLRGNHQRVNRATSHVRHQTDTDGTKSILIIRRDSPVIIEDNPSLHALFGSVECQAQEDALVTDFCRIRAGSLLRAHGGFLVLRVTDLLANEVVWEKLRRFLRCGRLQIEEPGSVFTPMASVSLTPEAVDVEVKIVLIGGTEHYYELQAADPEFVRRFRVKVDFAESFAASAQTYGASAVFVAQTCNKLGLPQFSAAAVARLLENSHREVDDQIRQSAIFSHAEALVMEAAAVCRARVATLVEAPDIDAAPAGTDFATRLSGPAIAAVHHGRRAFDYFIRGESQSAQRTDPDRFGGLSLWFSGAGDGCSQPAW